MTDDTNGPEYGPFAPGSLWETAKEEETEGQDNAPTFDLNARYAAATYKNVDGSQIDSPTDVLFSEHICVNCYHRNVCKHRPDAAAQELLIVISRCLAYEPDPA